MKAILFLLLVTLIWGTTFPLQKFVLTDFSPFVFNAIRFWIAALLSLFFTKKHIFKEALLLGTVLGLAYLTQTWGITLTTASKSGFLTSLYIVIVPLFAYLLEGEKIKGFQKIGFPFALIGSYLMAGGIDGLNLGDILNLICGILFALHLVLLTRVSKKHEEMGLLSVQFLVAAVINTIVVLFTGWDSHLNLPIVASVLYMAIFPSMLALLIQAKYQKKVGNNITALIFVGEPIFSTIFAIVFLQEQLSVNQWLGAALLITAILLAGFEKNRKRKISLIP
jgi:drug/metabolite transporter (DMT)-like permease